MHIAFCCFFIIWEKFSRWTSSNRRIWKERFSCLSQKHFRYYNCRTQLTLISSHGTLGLPVQQNLNSRSIFLTLSRCQNLQFYLIWLLFACSFIPLETWRVCSCDRLSIGKGENVFVLIDSKESRSLPYNKLEVTIWHHFCASASPISLSLTVVAIKTVDTTIGDQAFSHNRCNIFPGLSNK